MSTSSLFNPQNPVLAAYVAALFLLLTLTVLLVYLFIRSVGHDTLRVDSHWGGLGGGLGGWEFSRSLAYLIAAVSFALLSITVLKGAADYSKPPATDPQPKNNQAKDNAGTPGSASGSAGTPGGTGNAGASQDTSKGAAKDGTSAQTPPNTPAGTAKPPQTAPTGPAARDPRKP